MSGKITARFGADITEFEQAIVEMDRKARNAATAMSGTAEKSASAFIEAQKAQESLDASRRKIAFAEADSTGKIKILQADLAKLAKQRSSDETDTATKLKLQEQILLKMKEIREVRSDAKSASAASAAAAAIEAKKAQESLDASRRKIAFSEADSTGKIKILQADLAKLAKQRGSAEADTATKLKLQEQILLKMKAIREVRSDAKSASAASAAAAAKSIAEARAAAMSGTMAKDAGGLIKRLTQGNEQLAKAMILLRGGVFVAAVSAGVSVLLGKMRAFSDRAKEMGESATEAQKSAAKWGDELSAFGDTINEIGASALGTLAGWGRAIGDKFRSPMERAADGVAASSEEMAKRQEAALARTKKAHEDAANEIPGLLAKLKEAQDTAQVEEFAKGDRMGILMTEVARMESELKSVKAKPQNAINKAEAIRLETEITKKKSELNALFRAENERKDSEAAAKKAKAEQDAADTSAAEAKKEADARAERERMEADARFAKLSDEEKLIEIQKRGREAQAKALKSGKETDKLEVAKLRKEYWDLKGSMSKPADRYESIGLTRDEKGRLRRGKRVISEEDAKRTLAAREKDARNNARTGFAKSAEATLLEKIEKHLQPKKL